MQLPKFKLAVFDLDGTLFDTLTDIYSALSFVFKKYNLKIPSLAESRVFMGDGLKMFLEKAAAINGFMSNDDVMKDFISYYSMHCTIDTKPYDGVVETLDILKMNHIKMAVLSNKSIVFIKVILDYYKFSDYFTIVEGGDTVKEKKPSPLPLLDIIGKFDVKPNETIMIGDSENDIGCGFNAKTPTILCEYGYGNELKSKYDYSVSKASEIKDIILRNS